MNGIQLVEPTVEEISLEDGREMLRLQVSDLLGISLDEFYEHLDAGTYDDAEDESLFRLVMLAPFGRPA